ncbi:unnamed protein product, partial [Rotaria sp. Silwood2]
NIFACAAILENCSYINGSPQNTLVPGIIELAAKHNVFIGGDDFKSGQTKLKSVLADFLVSAGLKLQSIVSYNHLGNNDGKNLSAPQQFRSKEISKSNVVDDMVGANHLLYNKQRNEHPDHVVVIKYVPFVKVRSGLNQTSDEILQSIAANEEEISPSNIFACAAILENCSYINGSPQNTLVPGIIELAAKHNVFIGG